ncbi:MAG: DUF4377 domain-containing protein [Lysobacteraceae bacterium]|nr:MAG: DUF4377 domain-containing protein [Xanthomonadaceae bacterium]
MEKLVKAHMMLALLIGVAGCAQPPAPPESTPPPVPATASESELGAYHWRLEEATDSRGQRITALFVRAEAPVQLDFAQDRLRVANACNSMSGKFRIDGDAIHITPMIATKMACADPALMALDHEVASRLKGRIAWGLPATGLPRLELTTTDGDRLRFVGEPTTQSRYGGPGETVFIEVAAQRVPCPHAVIEGAECLQIRELRYDQNGLRVGAPGEWHMLYDQIEGYTHEKGTRNVLRLKRYPIANPPADASTLAYVLDLVVESETGAR